MGIKTAMQTVLKYVGVVIIGCAISIVLLVISEATGFTHINFVPLGGPSWGLWIYPIYLFIGFVGAYKLFRLPKKNFYTILIILLIITLVYYFGGDDSAFTNPIPFGINAY